jgi:hypothetical protein
MSMTSQPLHTRRHKLGSGTPAGAYSIESGRVVVGVSVRCDGCWLMVPVPGGPRWGADPRVCVRHSDGMAWLGE